MKECYMLLIGRSVPFPIAIWFLPVYSKFIDMLLRSIYMFVAPLSRN